MEYLEYKDTNAFLRATQPDFEKNEVLFGVMFAISLKLVKNPLHYGSKLPFLATISDKNGLQLVALMTPPHKLQIASFNSDSTSDSTELLAHHLHKGGWTVPAVTADEETSKHFARAWKTLTRCKSEQGMRLRLYQVREVKYNKYPSGCFRQATVSDLSCAISWCCSFEVDCFGRPDDDECKKTAMTLIDEGNLFLWEDPLPVSMAALVRSVNHFASISLVYTPPEFRNKGYASAVVASLSKLALNNGKEFCTLYTDLSNPTSNDIYRKIGYDVVADSMVMNFT